MTGNFKLDWLKENLSCPYETFIDPEALYGLLHQRESDPRFERLKTAALAVIFGARPVGDKVMVDTVFIKGLGEALGAMEISQGEELCL